MKKITESAERKVWAVIQPKSIFFAKYANNSKNAEAEAQEVLAEVQRENPSAELFKFGCRTGSFGNYLIAVVIR